MRRLAAMTLLACCPILVAAGDTQQPDVRFTQSEGWSRLDVVVPGKLLSVATMDASRTLYLLVKPVDYPAEPAPTEEPSEYGEEQGATLACPEPEDTSPPPPLALYRLELQQQELTPVRADLPGDGSALHVVDLDGDGEQELLLKRPGQFLELRSDGLLPLLESPLGIGGRLHASVDGAPAVVSATSGGSLRLYLAGAGTTGWQETAAIALPSTGKVHANGLSVRHAVPWYVGRSQDGKLLYATPPQAVGPRRLQVTLIALDPSSGEAQISDCWAGLPGPEKLLNYHFLLLEGRPMLLAETMPSDKLSLFGEKLLRLFPLETDRSRLGQAPLFAVKSHMNLWQDAHPVLVDVNRDGRMDLVIGYWKGLLSPRVALDAYVREPDGSFRSAPRTTAFDVKNGEGSYLHYGDDLDGDSLPDLLVRRDQSWLLHSGLPSSSGKKLVERKGTELPLEVQEIVETGVVEIQLSAAGVSRFTAAAQGKPQFADFAAGKGRAILLIWPGDRSSSGALQVLWR